MKKFKLFVENFFVYGIGGIISKIIPLIMLPIVARIMPNTEYYGINDLFSTVCSFAGAIAVLGMYDAMYRLFFDKDDKNFRRDICSTALVFSGCVSCFVALLLILCRNGLSVLAFGDKKYSYLMYFAAFSVVLHVINLITAAPTRMQNRRGIFLITNTLSSVFSYVLAILLLYMGYYIEALPLANIISLSLISIVFILLNRKWFSFKRYNKKYLGELLKIGLPLLPNFLIYWIFNSSDRVMITNIMGLADTGIYSIGAKLGHMSQLIYTAFGGGWLYFAYSTMHEDGQVKTNSMILEYLAAISLVCSIGVFALCKPIYQLLFTGDYVLGYIASPYLFLAPLLQMLFQVAANQFMIEKKSYMNMIMLLLGAISNIALNFILIPIIGIEGAAIGSLLGYAISLIVCIVFLRRKDLIIISRRLVIVTSMSILYIFVWRLELVEHFGVSLIVAVVVMLAIIVLYKKDITLLLNGLRNMRSNGSALND